MQLQSDKSHRLDEIKTQFRAREGYYRLMNSPDYSQRSQRAMGFSTGTANSNSSTASHEKTCIKISLVTVNDNNQLSTSSRQNSANRQRSAGTNNASPNIGPGHYRSRGKRDTKICFNVGRELFVYNYDGVRTGPDASNPIYKRSYKGSSPTCHDFNQATTTSGSIYLLVGFSHGQVQLINLNGSEDQDTCKEFNVDRLIDKTRVTCIKWLPNSPSLFLVAHASGQLYLYKDDLPCGPTAPIFQLYKRSEGVAVYTCKTKTTKNPIYKWTIGSQAAQEIGGAPVLSSPLANIENESCSLNEFVFSPCAKYLACVSQDGFLRVYCYDTMELIGRARSYYGGLSCVCWSPDGKYVVTGGEDDLITVWSFIERRVVARGLGHKSWVSVVAFDKYYTGYDLNDLDVDNDDDDEEDEDIRNKELGAMENDEQEDDLLTNRGSQSKIDKLGMSGGQNDDSPTSYRFGSVGQDTQLCLWDLNDDLLKQPIAKNRVTSSSGVNSVINLDSISASPDNNETCNQAYLSNSQTGVAVKNESVGNSNTIDTQNNKKVSGFTKTFSLVGKRDKRKNMAPGNNALEYGSTGMDDDPVKLLGSPICPRMNEVPLLEPLVCKKISFERLTSLIFCQGGFITSCQDGYVFSWARPSRKSLRVSPGQSNEELRVIDVGTSSVV